MYRLFTFSFIAAFGIAGAQAPKTLKVLFLGNSYTFVNNLPQLIKDVAKANGDSLLYDSNCPGGYTFNGHFNDATSKAKAGSGLFNYVVLQAQSQEPSFSPAQVNTQTFPYALKLDSIIKKGNPCTPSVFFETWGRKNGDAANCPFYPPVCTYTGMQNRLRQSYKQFADTTKGIMAPVGEAFRASISASPAVNLYQADESHPSLEGSYLAAAVFYEIVYNKSVLSNTYNPGIGTATLAFLKQMAHLTVSDSLWTWNIGKNVPYAAFTHSFQSSSLVQFQSKSPLMNNKWYFGDGAVSNAASPVYNYTSSGTFTVSHVSYTSCLRDSAIAVLSPTPPPSALIVHENQVYNIRAFPNPASGEVNFYPEPGENSVVRVYNQLGQLIYNEPFLHQLNVSGWPATCYLIEISSPAGVFRTRLVKSD